MQNGNRTKIFERFKALWGSGGRELTPAEVVLARKVYGDAIDYERVRIFAHPYAWPQPRNSGMAPFGGIYCADIYQPDFGAAKPHLQALFIHELAHVYQYQLKILHPVVAAAREHLRHRFDYPRCYRYELRSDWDLLHYGMEQQAVIIEDYARMALLGMTQPACHFGATPTAPVTLAQLRVPLARFLADPNYPRQPRWRLRHLVGLCYSNVNPAGYA